MQVQYNQPAIVVACLIGSWKSMNMMVIFLFFFVNLWVQFWKSWISTGPRVQVCFELFIFLLAEHSRQRWLIKRTFFFFFNILPNYNIRESNHVNFHDEHFEPSLSIHGFIVCVFFLIFSSSLKLNILRYTHMTGDAGTLVHTCRLTRQKDWAPAV